MTERTFNSGNFTEATIFLFKTVGVISNVTNSIDFYNVLKKVEIHVIDDPDEEVLYKVMNDPVVEALRLNVSWKNDSEDVFKHLIGDFMKPCTKIVEQLLNHTQIKIIVYNGQLDLIVNTPGTVKWVDDLQWKGGKKWFRAKREALIVNGTIEGYVKRVGNLVFYWVNRAGHMVRKC